ncbi:hypothetical protein EV368DRAFT_68916 [Lentinula lateritia]|nr:hypothetical protein EV368DRAFT_68916 [Lentinula lateritia]
MYGSPSVTWGSEIVQLHHIQLWAWTFELLVCTIFFLSRTSMVPLNRDMEMVQLHYTRNFDGRLQPYEISQLSGLLDMVPLNRDMEMVQLHYTRNFGSHLKDGRLKLCVGYGVRELSTTFELLGRKGATVLHQIVHRKPFAYSSQL